MIVQAGMMAMLLMTGASGSASAQATGTANPRDPQSWVIGPIIRGRNHSVGMPLNPAPGPRGAWHIDIPRAPGSAHYVTFRQGSLAGKRRIVMRYRVEAARGVQIVPRTAPQQASIITLYFQRRGDNWTARGPYETYRWYATFASQSPITPGEHVMVAPLDGRWTAVQSSTAQSAPRAFQAALANADQVGFVLGGGDGYGHGIFATGPARIIVLDYRIE